MCFIWRSLFHNIDGKCSYLHHKTRFTVHPFIKRLPNEYYIKRVYNILWYFKVEEYTFLKGKVEKPALFHLYHAEANGRWWNCVNLDQCNTEPSCRPDTSSESSCHSSVSSQTDSPCFCVGGFALSWVNSKLLEIAFYCLYWVSVTWMLFVVICHHRSHFCQKLYSLLRHQL